MISSAYFSTVSIACSHSLSQTYFQPVSIWGNSSPFISAVYTLINYINISALISLPFIFLVRILPLIKRRNSITCSINSGRSWSIYKVSSFCSYSSLVKGRTKVKQLLWGNEALIDCRILFRTYESPGWGLKDCSKYCFVESGWLSLPTKAKEKSRNTQ